MTDKRRAWFQIHLSTAIVLMFVAGGLLRLNMVETKSVQLVAISGINELQNRPSVEKGWPVAWSIAVEYKFQILNLSLPKGQDVYHDRIFSWSGLFADSAVAVLMLACVGTLAESMRCRREARKP